MNKTLWTYFILSRFGVSLNQEESTNAKQASYTQIVAFSEPIEPKCRTFEGCHATASSHAMPKTGAPALSGSQQDQGLLGRSQDPDKGIPQQSPRAKDGAFRPSGVLWLFWVTQLVIEEDAERLEPIVLKGAA